MLLIVPIGIEISAKLFFVFLQTSLLIVPVGIEIFKW